MGYKPPTTIRHWCTRNHRNGMPLILLIHSILCNVGLFSNISSNLYHFLPYSLSYSIHKKSDICVNKYLLMILTIKVTTQKSSYISYKLIYLLRKRGITQSIRHIPKRIWEKWETYPRSHHGHPSSISSSHISILQ